MKTEMNETQGTVYFECKGNGDTYMPIVNDEIHVYQFTPIDVGVRHQTPYEYNTAYDMQRILAIIMADKSFYNDLRITYNMAKSWRPAWMAEVLDAIIMGSGKLDNSKIMITPQIESAEITLLYHGKKIIEQGNESATIMFKGCQERLLNDYKRTLIDEAEAEYSGGKITSDVMYAKIKDAESVTSQADTWEDNPSDLFNLVTAPRPIVNFMGLDELTRHSILQNDLVVIGADTGKGKTAFAVQIANSLIDSGYSVQYANVEVDHGDMYRRFIANKFSIKMDTIAMFNADVFDPKWQKLTKAQAKAITDLKPKVINYLNNLASSHFKIISYKNNVDAILAEAAQRMSENEKNVLIIDHLGLLVSDDDESGNAPQNRARTVRKLRMFSVNHNCLVIALSQLNREEKKKEKAGLHGLDGSGEIENSASVVIILNDSDKSDPCNQAAKVIEADFAKNRNGITDPITYTFTPERAYFREKPEENNTDL